MKARSALAKLLQQRLRRRKKQRCYGCLVSYCDLVTVTRGQEECPS